MQDNEKLELAKVMFAAWERMDWDGIVELFSADGVLHSVMQEPLVGHAAIADRLAVLGSKSERIELQVKSLGVIDGRVFVERRDVFDFDGHHGEVPVVGILSMADGLVTEWLEYYDRPTLLAGLGMTADFSEE